MKQPRLGLTDDLRCHSATSLDCGGHCSTTSNISTRNRQRGIAINGNKCRSTAYRHYAIVQLFEVERAIKPNQYNIRRSWIVIGNLQIPGPDEIEEWRLTYNIDVCAWETMDDIVHCRICCDQYMIRVCRDAQTLELVDNIQSAGIRVVGQEKVLFLRLIEPTNELLRPG